MNESGSNVMGARRVLALASVVLVHIWLRVAAWLSNAEIENHDGIGFLEQARIILTGTAAEVWTMTPDALPMFPAAIALFSMLPGDLETAARLVSLCASLATLFCVYWLTLRWAGFGAALLAMALLATNPMFIGWGYAILMEPLYIAFVSLGLVLFFRNTPRYTVVGGIVVGIIFALSFLTRLEGILYLAAIPGLMLIVQWFDRHQPGARQRTIHFLPPLACVIAFIVVAAPQVVRVSDYMGTLSLNGRSTWSLLENAPGNAPYGQRLYGLDHDPATVNLYYLQQHSEAQDAFVSDIGVVRLGVAYVRTVMANLEDLHDNVINPLVGAPVLIFALIGLFSMLRGAQRRDALLVVALLLVMLTAPLLHNVEPRHVAVIGPLLFCLAAIGVARTAREIHSWDRIERKAAVTMTALIVLFCASPYAMDVRKMLVDPDTVNQQYEETAMQRAAARFREAAGANPGDRPSVVTRRIYIGYFANAKTFPMPYTDLDGLERYMELNNVEYVFVEQGIESFPFIEPLSSGNESQQFELVFREPDGRGGTMQLFRKRSGVARRENP